MYWDREPPPEIAENFDLHRALPSFQTDIFDKDRAAEWLYNFYGVAAREIFLHARHPAEAADILRIHVINIYGGYWLDADLRIRSVPRFDEILGGNSEAVFMTTPSHVVHNDFFGSAPGTQILGDCLLSLYRNCYQHHDLYIAFKTGPGVFARALNRAFYRAATGRGPVPAIRVLGQRAFDDVVDAFPVTYKHGARSWHSVG